MKSLGRLFWALCAIAFAVGSGCGNPELISDSGLNSSGGVGDEGSGATAAKGTGATLSFGGDATGGATGDCPATCADLDADCGFVTDTKCGGVIQCGTHCPAGEVCGGGGKSKCGKGTTPLGGVCMPSTCDELNANCGYVTDTKCGGVVQCGTKCKTGQICGGSEPNQCGVAVDGGKTCVVDPATTCAGRGYTCGQAADNCGNLLDCGPDTCANPSETCFQGTCKSSGCVVDPATTCDGLGYSCGQAADNCGNLLTCGAATCPIPGFTCGGGSDKNGKPIAGVCGCTGACSLIPDCGTGKTTTLSGKVYDPAGEDPLYHVLVYIANDPTDPALTSFPKGITCDVCGASAAGSPLVSDPTLTDPPAGTYTGVDGSFTLKNVPVGKALTLVIQLGRWRRVFKVDVTKSCAANTLPDKTLLMPSTQAQGDIPLMAMVTGNADSLECVLRKMGISSTEFTDPAKGGRVQFYGGTGNSGQTIDAATPDQASLFATVANQPVIDNYDMVILACQGDEYKQKAADLKTLRTYADQGGRVFSTHYSYVWLTNNDAVVGAPAGTQDNWSEVAKWHRDEVDRPGSAVGIIDKLSNPKAAAFQGWLEAVNASAVGSGTIAVNVIRHDADLISARPGQTQQWLYRAGANAQRCTASGGICQANTDCTAKVCQANPGMACPLGTECSAMACNNGQHGPCTNNNQCTGNGRCVANPCVANTCAGSDYRNTEVPLHFTFNTPVNLTEDLTKTPPAVQCGRVLFSDFHVEDASEHGETYPVQCGKACTKGTDCTGHCGGGKCPWGAACKADADCASTCSTDGRCLDPMTPQEKLLEFMIFDLGSCVPPPKTCVPATTCPADQDCGYAPDGCGGLVMCGNCPKGEACGVGNPPVANKCGSVTCTPGVCPADQECGYASDGCSGAVLCGTCPKGQTCNAGKCGTGKCTPQSCTDQGIECGSAGDLCGNQVDCPACAPGEACVNGACIPEGCTPVSCTDQGVQCGPAADGCGNMISSCGQCTAGQLCVLGKCKSVN